MAITINGTTYRNLQEQVAKNQEDIEELQNLLEPHVHNVAMVTDLGTFLFTVYNNSTELIDTEDALLEAMKNNTRYLTSALYMEGSDPALATYVFRSGDSITVGGQLLDLSDEVESTVSVTSVNDKLVF